MSTGSEYRAIFDARGDSYNQAGIRQPRARQLECELLIQRLDIQAGHVVVDAPAGGGYVADRIRPLVSTPGQIICVEPSSVFAQGLSPDYCLCSRPISDTGLGSGSVDRVASLAGLHHLQNKQLFFDESFRILQSKGVVAVGDVLEDTPAARFLNGPVDRYTQTGHRGMFLQPGELSRMLESAGFTRIREQHEEFDWSFQSMSDCAAYAHSLFGMVRVTEAETDRLLHEYFDIREEAGEIKLPWSLVYVSGEKE